MKAAICTRYGSPEVIAIQNVPTPQPKANEVLIKIISTAVNSGDVRVRGLVVGGFFKIIMKFVIGFSKPRQPILGTVFSGIIESVGEKVSNFSVGDEVFGMTGFKFGTHAEYIALPSTAYIYKKPSNANHDEAASIIFGGQTAIYFLDKLKIDKNLSPSILIIGATGSVGFSAIQIAKHRGAIVTAVCNSEGKKIIEHLGMDTIIEYDKDDYLNSERKYDYIFDAVGKMPHKSCKHLLKKNGKYVTVAGLDTASEKIEQLKLLKEMYESGDLKTHIDRTYSLEEIKEAHRYVDTGRKKGNVVIQVFQNFREIFLD